VEDALAHPYLSLLSDPSDEPVCHSPFEFSLDEDSLTQEQLRRLIYKEALQFHPHFQD
jgi:mitogen-activated protein kinase 6